MTACLTHSMETYNAGCLHLALSVRKRITEASTRVTGPQECLHNDARDPPRIITSLAWWLLYCKFPLTRPMGICPSLQGSTGHVEQAVSTIARLRAIPSERW